MLCAWLERPAELMRLPPVLALVCWGAAASEISEEQAAPWQTMTGECKSQT